MNVYNFPFHEDFNADDYQGIVWTSGGGQHEWVDSGGWKGTGAAKFYPPTQNDKVSGLGQFTEFNNGNGYEQVNVRFLIYHGPEYYKVPGRQKLVILNRGDNIPRPMIGDMSYSGGHQENQFRAYAPCDNTVCQYVSGNYPWWPGANEHLRIGPGPENRSEEWISVELEANMMTGMINVYIDTQDGELSGLYMQKPFSESPVGGTPFRFIDLIGGYFNTGSPHDPRNIL
jgi:hypothetical protein